MLDFSFISSERQISNEHRSVLVPLRSWTTVVSSTERSVTTSSAERLPSSAKRLPSSHVALHRCSNSSSVVLQLGECLASADFEIDSLSRLFSMSENIIEGLCLCFRNVKDGTHLGSKSSHAQDGRSYTFRKEPSEDVPHKPNSEELLLQINLVGDVVFLSVEQRPVGHCLLVSSRHECKSHFQSLLCISVLQSNQFLSCIVEQRQDVFLNLHALLDGVSRGCSDDVLGLRDSNLSEVHTSFVRNHGQLLLVLQCPESYASSCFACSSSSTSSVNVSFSVLRRLNLNY